MNLSRSNQGRVLFLSLLIAGAAVVPGRAQSSANPDANVSTGPQIYGSEPREPEEQPEDNQKGRSLYENPRRMQQLSGAARSSLERRYGRQKPAPIQPAKTAVAQPGELLGAITNVLVNDPRADGTSHDTQNETAVALGSGLNVIAAFNDSGSLLVGSNHFTGYAVSTNGGISFLDRGVLPNSPEGDTGDPVLAHALGVGNIPETVYLCTLGAVTFERVQLFRSFNNGLTFAAPVNATPGFTGSGDFQDKPWIAVDNYPGEGQGNVYLAWRNFPPSSSPGPGPYGIRFTRSTDGGAVWGPNRGVVIASEGANNVQGAYVTVGPDHAVYVFWLDQSGGNGVPNAIKLRKSIDRGITFGPAVTAAILNNRNDNGDLGLEFRSDSFPQAAINPVNGNVYVVYNDDPPGGDRADVYFRQSTDGGLTWGGAVRVNDDVTSTDQYFPVLAVTPNGLRLFVGFYDRRLDRKSTRLNSSQ